MFSSGVEQSELQVKRPSSRLASEEEEQKVEFGSVKLQLSDTGCLLLGSWRQQLGPAH